LRELPRPSVFDALLRPKWFAPGLLCLSAAISWIFADRTMPIPDEGALLTAAVKLLHGGVFYRDVDAYALPGASYLLALAMAIFGEHLAVARAIAGATFCAMVLGVYGCALSLMDTKRAAVCGLALLGLKFVAYPIYTMFFYADISVAAALLALALFLRHDFAGPSKRLFFVGLLTAASIVTKQSTGLLVAIVFGLVLSLPGFAHAIRSTNTRRAELASYGAGLALALGTMSLYFVFNGVFGDMLRGAFVRPFTGYWPTSEVSFLPPLAWWQFGRLVESGPTYFPQLYFELVLYWSHLDPQSTDLGFALGEIASRLIYTSLPVVFGICAGLWIQALLRPSEGGRDGSRPATAVLAKGRFFSAAGVSLAIVASAFPRADFVHVVTVYPAVVLTLFALGRPSLLGVSSSGEHDSPMPARSRRLGIEGASVLILLALTSWLSLRYDSILTHRISIDRADLWVKPQHAWLESLVEFVQSEVPPGEPLFVYGHEAQWYFLTDRYTPRPFSQLYPGMTSDETGEEIAGLIARTRPRVILQGILHWPGMPDLRPYTPEVSRALEEFYISDPHAIPRPPRARLLRVWRAGQ